MLAFTNVYFLGSGLFNGLHPIQTKKFPSPLGAGPGLKCGALRPALRCSHPSELSNAGSSYPKIIPRISHLGKIMSNGRGPLSPSRPKRSTRGRGDFSMQSARGDQSESTASPIWRSILRLSGKWVLIPILKEYNRLYSMIYDGSAFRMDWARCAYGSCRRHLRRAVLSSGSAPSLRMNNQWRSARSRE